MTELMTPKEVAAYLRVHYRTVTKWARTGKLRSVRTPGNRIRLLTADVIALVDFEGGLGGEETSAPDEPPAA